MKKEVGQERAHDPSLRRSSFPADETHPPSGRVPSTIGRDKAAPTGSPYACAPPASTAPCRFRRRRI
jgi:hypothetical protein